MITNTLIQKQIISCHQGRINIYIEALNKILRQMIILVKVYIKIIHISHCSLMKLAILQILNINLKEPLFFAFIVFHHYLHSFDIFFRANISQYMFHCFEVRALDYPKLQKGRILFLIALHNNRMAVINEFNNLTVLKLPFSKPIVNINLPFKPRKVAAIKSNGLLIFSAEARALYQLDLITSQVALVYSFEVGNFFNNTYVILKEKEYMSTIQLEVFPQTNSCFLKEERTEQRKIKLHYFCKQQTDNTTKKLEIGSVWNYTCSLQNMNGSSLIDKYDKKSKVVFFKQTIDQNGIFTFSIFDLKTNQLREINLDHQSFNTISVVRTIKAVEKGFVLSLNHKNPQFLFFNEDLRCQSKNIPTSLLSLHILPQFMIDVSFSDQNQQKSRLSLRNLDGNLVDVRYGSFQDLSIEENGEWIIDYKRQKKQTDWISFCCYRIMKKQMLLLNILQKNYARYQISSDFKIEVLRLLE